MSENNNVFASKSNDNFERKLSPLNVWALALGCIVGGSAFVMPATTFLPRAGTAGTTIALFCGALVMIIIAFNYSYMISKYPQAGGELTYAKNAFGKKHAFLCSWFLELSYISLVPLNATALALMGRTIFNNFLQIGFHYTVAGYDIYCGEILFAYIALFILAYISIKGVKISGILQTLLVAGLIGGVGIVLLAVILNSDIVFSDLSPAFVPGKGKIECILAVFAIAPWAFVGFDTIPQSAEEFKFSSKKTKFLMTFSILFGALIYIVINSITAIVIPEGYSSWIEYIEDINNLSGLMAMPTFHAAYQLLGIGGLAFIAIAVFAACLTGIIGFLMASSRMLYAMSKENFVPSCFGQINGKNKTPKNALIFVLFLSLLGPIFGRTALGWIVDMTSIGAAIGYGYTSAATIKYAYKDKKILYIITGVLGVICSIIFSVLLLIPIKKFDCSLGKEAYICLIVWCIIGFVFYLKLRQKEY